MGRPRKFKLGDIVWDDFRQQHSVVVNYRRSGTVSESRCIALDKRLRRRGDAYWERVQNLEPTAYRSQTGSIKTYLANELLEQQLEGRGCSCQCCIHEAQERSMFNNQGEYSPCRLGTPSEKRDDGQERTSRKGA
jgi:hypothetical protein